MVTTPRCHPEAQPKDLQLFFALPTWHCPVSRLHTRNTQERCHVERSQAESKHLRLLFALSALPVNHPELQIRLAERIGDLPLIEQ
jgi:hypothetical protein